jgi:tRNA pseudouridine55 synthase
MMIHGFLNIDKPAGMTSHDVVAQVRRLAKVKRVGHAGTLDPAATGVLVVALGLATRLIEYVQEETSKRYRAVVRLGITTTTEDAEGEVLATAPVPLLDAAAIAEVLGGFVGEIEQVPPMYSALHHQGRRLHELARAGEVVDLASRPVRVERIDLLAWQNPLLELDIVCGKGTYIRSLARDIGAAIGCGAHVAALRRTAVGSFSIDSAISLEQLAHAAANARLADLLLAPDIAIADWPIVTLDEPAARLVRNGMPIEFGNVAGTRARAYLTDGTLLALLVRREDNWKPDKVFDWT